MYIGEWFDPHNIEHVEAWNCINVTGAWPEGFIPPNVCVYGMWQVVLAFKMADAWTKEALNKS